MRLTSTNQSLNRAFVAENCFDGDTVVRKVIFPQADNITNPDRIGNTLIVEGNASLPRRCNELFLAELHQG
jgi:hypothetical protein